MKKILTTLIIAAASTVSFAAGTDVPASFNVTMSLAQKCIITSGASSTTNLTSLSDIALGQYTAFGSALDGSNNFFVRCTDNLSYSIKLDGYTFTDGPTGLNYVMALTNSTATISAAGTDPGTQAGAAAGTQWYVHAHVPAGQGGNATAAAANNTRTVTVTY